MDTTENGKTRYESSSRGAATVGQAERDEFTKHLFETVREPLLALNSDLRVWLANKSFYKFFRVTSDETEGQHIFELGNGQWNIPQLRRLLEEIIPRDENFDDFEVEHVFERIGRKHVLLNARRINHGRLILLAIEDVTERRRMENELKGFAQIAAHDLKEPLRTVTSYLGLLEKQTDWHDEQGIEYFKFAIDGARRMAILIDNLLAYSSIGTQGKLVSVDLNGAFRNVLTNLKMLISENSAQVTKDELPTVVGDSTEFEQLFQNLFSNAIKYKGTEPPKVHISAVKKGGVWLFKVQDNGMGIAVGDQSRIFDAFRRLHTRSEYPGTGLGLSTCRKIVESHGGSIWVESEQGCGSTFFFTLPVGETTPNLRKF